VAVFTRGSGGSGAYGQNVPGLVERRVYVQAPARLVWAVLHDPVNTAALFPELRLETAAPAWPAAATTREGSARVGLLRERARAESLEARPAASFRMRVSGSGFTSEWSWRLEPAAAGGTRVIHAATFDPLDRWAGLLVRLGRRSLASRVEGHLRVLKERAEGAERSTPRSS
jgi:carbon monoxide dehydrogenase subunit G